LGFPGGRAWTESECRRRHDDAFRALMRCAGGVGDDEDVTHLSGKTSKEKAMFILSKSGVAGVPDEAFFHEPGESQFIRFCFDKEDKELDEACRRLERLKLTEAIKIQWQMQKGDIVR